jgi:Copper amine oxidase N-terminal domain/Glucodextranase, domain B
MIRKIAVCLTLLCLVIPTGMVSSACPIQIYDILVNPPTAQATACYTVLFLTSCDLSAGEYITFHLPKGSELPYGCRSCGARIDNRFNDRITTAGNQVQFQLQTTLNSGRHKFVICNVTNPSSRGPHFISVVTRDGIFSSAPFNFSDTSITTPKVKVTPDYVEACAEYEIIFRTSSDDESRCGCKKKTSITIEFPKGMSLPQKIDPQFILVNGRPADYILIKNNIITISPQNNLRAGETVRITILSGAGIKNPSKPGWYRIKMHTSADRLPRESEAYYIRPSTVTRAKVTIDDPFTCASTSLTIKFQTGPYGEIKTGQVIQLLFPPGFIIPKEFPDGSISVNNEPVTKTPRISKDNIDDWNRIEISSPVFIPAESDVEIILLPSAGISLPEAPGNDYQIDVRTSSEFSRVPSWGFTITRSRLRNVNLEMSPVFIGLPSVAKISFKLGGCGGIKPGFDTITVSFGKDFWFPETKLFTDITVNGIPVDKLVTVDDHKITLSPPEEIQGGEWVTIIFGKNCGIRNPSKAGIVHKVRVWTNREPEPSPSSVVVFATTKISGVNVTLEKPLTNKWTGGKISFVLGSAGALKAGSKINIKFMGDFDFKGIVSARTITMGESKPMRVKWNKPDLTLNTSVDFEAGSAITIFIDSSANLRLPETPDFYTVLVSTDAEPEPIPSAEFGIADPTLITCELDPKEPDGAGGWYKTQPTLTIHAGNSLDKFPNIICEINFDTFVYHSPVTLEDGFMVIKVSVTDKFGNKTTSDLSLNIDSHPPTFEPESGRIYSRSGIHREMIEVVDENKITVEYDKDAPFKVEVSRTGLVWITSETKTEGDVNTYFTAIDTAGNRSTWERTITFDWTAPELAVPSSFRTEKKRVQITGKTEPVCSLTLEMEETSDIKISEDGSFSFEIELTNGHNHLVFTSTDSAGNRTIESLSIQAELTRIVTIELGSKRATVGLEEITLSHAPYLKNGNAMIPLRFVSSSLGAEINYEASTKKITVSLDGISVEMIIGNSTALVDGEVSVMPVAPELVSGSTFVPLRFLCESLGMVISVSGKIITISYTAR